MKVLHINTLDAGGAFNAAFRLHEGLLQLKIDSTFLSKKKLFKKGCVDEGFPVFSRFGFSLKKRILNKLRIQLSNTSVKIYDHNQLNQSIECFSSPNTDFKLGEYIIDYFKPDIVNLHWVADFLDYTEFFAAINIPVVWTLHDQAPFSSYWHYSNDHIQNSKARSIHSKYISIKRKALEKFDFPIEIVAPSNWLMNESKKSPVFEKFPHQMVRNGIDTDLYKITHEIPKGLNTEDLNEIKIKLLFICQSIDNVRKGMALLLEALELIKHHNFQLIAIGESTDSVSNKLPSDTIYTGRISDQAELVKYYNLADYTIIPSLQDNLPNTLVESLCCGTPVIGTPAGGVFEILQDDKFGILSQGFLPSQLSTALEKAMSNFDKFNSTAIAAGAADIFQIKKQADSYVDIYHALLSSNNSHRKE